MINCRQSCDTTEGRQQLLIMLYDKWKKNNKNNMTWSLNFEFCIRTAVFRIHIHSDSMFSFEYEIIMSQYLGYYENFK